MDTKYSTSVFGIYNIMSVIGRKSLSDLRYKNNEK